MILVARPLSPGDEGGKSSRKDQDWTRV